MKNAKGFLRSAIILTAALVVICVFMPEWGIMQIVVVLLVTMLAGFQWFLFFYIKNVK